MSGNFVMAYVKPRLAVPRRYWDLPVQTVLLQAPTANQSYGIYAIRFETGEIIQPVSGDMLDFNYAARTAAAAAAAPSNPPPAGYVPPFLYGQAAYNASVAAAAAASSKGGRKRKTNKKGGRRRRTTKK